ncbi:MarR family transcriptional regulator [Nocardia sp. ET3-3]|uniref:MarR family transcriptional regulator n=1 Tax=Nocardia terrae TaxID=2675851 RepID=A0A7K1UTA9_9NOCA|nr:MarR family transcriptional regulator [Nocardia terrae]MVU77389.1 MarR family transcriptional regulator [Nocardia terrae]
MSSVTNGDPRGRRRLVTAVKGSLRDLRGQLALLNRQVGGRLELKEADMDCLDLITARGPISPTALARAAGLHPATMTGILDRLERAGFIARERAETDRRAILLRAIPERTADVYALFSDMNAEMDTLCEGYSTEELALLADFLQRCAEAGRRSTGRLAEN